MIGSVYERCDSDETDIDDRSRRANDDLLRERWLSFAIRVSDGLEALHRSVGAHLLHDGHDLERQLSRWSDANSLVM